MLSEIGLVDGFVGAFFTALAGAGLLWLGRSTGWKQLHPAPPQKLKGDKIKQEYDYIVVGAGKLKLLFRWKQVKFELPCSCI